MHTQKKKKLKITLPVLAVALFLQMRWRSVIFPEFFSHLQFLRNREGSKEKRKKKTSGYRIPLIQTASQTQRQLSPTSLTSQLWVKTNGNNPAAGSNWVVIILINWTISQEFMEGVNPTAAKSLCMFGGGFTTNDLEIPGLIRYIRRVNLLVCLWKWKSCWRWE